MELQEATVIASSPLTNTVDIELDSSELQRVIKHNVPIMVALHDPALRGGIVHLPKVGTKVIVAESGGGSHFVLGCLPEYMDRPPAPEEGATTGGGSLGGILPVTMGQNSGLDPVYSKMGGPSYRGAKPPETLPGDWVCYGSEGNAVGVLEGGVTLLKGSESSQVILNKSDDSVTVVARKFKLHSDFGEMVFFSETGNAGLSIRGHNSTADSSNGDYNLELSLGVNGKPHIRLGTEDCFLELRNGKIYHKGDLIRLPSGRDSQEVSVRQSGPEFRRVNGFSTLNVSGEKKETIGESSLLEVGGDLSSRVDGDRVCTARNMQVTSTGQYTLNAVGWSNATLDGPPIPGKDAVRIEAVNGDLVLQAGDVTIDSRVPGPNSATLRPSVRVDSYNGDIKLRCTGNGGTIELSAPTPPSLMGTGGSLWGIVLSSPKVLVGTTPGTHHTPHTSAGPYPPSPMAIAKTPPLIEWMKAITRALVTHIHPTPVGPTAPSPNLAVELPAANLIAEATVGSRVAFVPPV